MLKTRDAWQDGQAGVSWLTGTHIAQWVVTYIKNDMKDEREEKFPTVATRLISSSKCIKIQPHIFSTAVIGSASSKCSVFAPLNCYFQNY